MSAAVQNFGSAYDYERRWRDVGLNVAAKLRNLPTAASPCADAVTPASIACRPDEKLATLKERLQFSNVRHPFDREHRLDQALRRFASQDWHDEIACQLE